MHTRTKIRRAVKVLLEDNDKLRNLFVAKGRATREDKSPYVNIVTGIERADPQSEQWTQARIVQVQVRLYVQAGDESADVLDELAEVCEVLLCKDQTLGGICQTFEYKGADPDYETAAQQELANLVLEYECKYIWEPSFDADEFIIAAVEIDMAQPRNDPQTPAGPDDQIDASATIELEQ